MAGCEMAGREIHLWSGQSPDYRVGGALHPHAKHDTELIKW
jgi:hypothetical protein